MLKTIAEAFAQKVRKHIQKPVDKNLLKELLNKLLAKLNSEYIYPESFSLEQFADNKIFLELEIDGDWKHDHLYCEHLVKNFCDENNIEILGVEEEVYHEEEETSYSDDYVALHTWELFIESNLEEDLSNKTGKLMIWTKDEDDNDYHSSWIEIPADIDADGFEALLWNNGYEVHDSEEDPDWFDYEDREDEKDNYHFAIELGSAARWWEFTSLEGCLNWFKQGNSNTFNNANKLYPLDKENVKEGWVIYYRPEDGDRVRFIKANDSSFLPEDEKELQKEYIGKIATITYVGSQFVSNDRVGLRFDDGKRFDCSSWQIEPLQKRPKVTEELVNEEQLEETYSDDELNRMVGKVYNIRKLDKWYRNDKGLFAHTICTKCGREKDVFLSNLINDPDKYGSCICSDENIDAKIDYAQKLYTGGKKLSSNTSGYTGVSFVKNYKGQPYNKWRAYIEVDGKRTYLGDFTKKKDAVKARKVAAEKGVKWYKENKNKITRDLRRKTKKYTTSKYRDSKRKTINLKEK